MQYNQFISLIRQGAARPEEISLLKSFIEEYPYCQSARLLYSKFLFDTQDVHSEKTLKLTAVYAGDRKKLQQYISSQSEENNIPELIDSHESVFMDETISASNDQSVFKNIEDQSFLTVEDKTENIFTANPQEDSVENIFVEPSTLRDSTIFSESFSEIAKEKPATIPIEVPDSISFEPAVSAQEELTDPHEIIRRRLNEIFAGKNQASETIDPKKKESEPAIENFIPSVENDAKEKVIPSDILSEIEAEAITSTDSAKNYHGGPEEIIIRKEVMLMKDEVDKEELAHAAEETILHSLEKLPSPHQESDHLTFFGWLKVKSSGQFGKVEEVHGGDSPSITTFSSQEKAIIETPEVEEDLLTDKNPEPAESPDKLIERFIATEPRITPSKTEFYSPAIQAKKSVEEDESLVTETLANIYKEQGMLGKARAAYEKLSLVYPEKSASFAALIQEIDKSLNTEE